MPSFYFFKQQVQNLKKKIRCNNCGETIHTFEEKETDVRLATRLTNDVYKDRCDISIIVSADSDLIPAIETIKEIKVEHKIFVYFPPLRHSVTLDTSCDGTTKLLQFKSRFNQSILQDRITLTNGVVLTRPKNWS